MYWTRRWAARCLVALETERVTSVLGDSAQSRAHLEHKSNTSDSYVAGLFDGLLCGCVNIIFVGEHQGPDRGLM